MADTPSISICRQLIFKKKKSGPCYFLYALELSNSYKENFTPKIQMKQLWPKQMTPKVAGWRTVFTVGDWQSACRDTRLCGEWAQLPLAGGSYTVCAWGSKGKGVVRVWLMWLLATLSLSSAFWNEHSFNYCVITWHYVIADCWWFPV